MASYTYQTLPFELRNTKRWRSVDLSQLPNEDRERFIKLKNAIENYLGTGKLKASSDLAGCAPSTLLRQLNRCVSVTADNEIFGWLGLIKHTRVNVYTRRQPLPSGEISHPGNRAGAFQAFLSEHKDIRERLDALILQRPLKGRIHQSQISFKDLAQDLRNLCQKAGITDDQYPLNSKSKARQSITRYAKELITENAGRGTWARFGDRAWKHLRVGTGHQSLVPGYVPMRVWGLDAHKVDALGCIIVPGPKGPQKILVERLWFIPVLDLGSTAVLGYSAGIRTEVSAETVEEAVSNALEGWRPKISMETGITYSEGAALPSYVFPELIGCAPAMLKIDNAVQHYANRVAEQMRKRLGCCLCFGGIGRWDHGSITERLFKTLEIHGFRKLPSTTGSNSTDPIRREAEKAALKHGIEWGHLLEILDVLVANYNANRNRGLGGQTPLEVMELALDPARPRSLLRPLPEATLEIPELGSIVIKTHLRGSQRNGIRPYLQFKNARYSSPSLARCFSQVGQVMVLKLKTKDVSRGEAYSLEGESFGEVVAAGVWGHVPHSLDIRRSISDLMNDAAVYLAPGENPVTQLSQYYANKAYEDARKRPRSVSKAATKLAKIVHESGQPVPTAQEKLPASHSPEPPVRPLSKMVKTPAWKAVT